ncbi:MAG: ABC-2 transporter permease [Acidobacteria bacterium]|nr:ABC-2 transporter permease [Acidobacteriota bacterium]
MNIILFVWRDLRSCARWLALAAGVFAVHGAAAFPFPGVYLMLTTLFPLFLAIGPLLVEARHPTDRLWASLPLRRWELVAARYAAAALGVGIGLAAAVGWSALLWTVYPPVRWPAVPPLTVAAAALGLVFLLAWLLIVYLPFAFRFGAARGPVVFACSLLGLSVLVSVLQHLAATLLPATGTSWVASVLRAPGKTILSALSAARDLWGAPLLLALLAVLTVALAAASLALSIRFYRQRDL